MEILILIVAQWYFSLFFQTFYLHRYAAHQMFAISKFWEFIFTTGTWVSQGASYLNPWVYGTMHRMHHAYADTEKDVHSPKYDKSPMAMLWKTKKVYSAISNGTFPMEDRFKSDNPTRFLIETFYVSWISRLLWVGVYGFFYYTFVTQWWMWVFLPINLTMGPIHGLIINWVAHKVGYRNFEVSDTSTNLMKWDIFMMGEGLHNNHHKRGDQPNFAYKSNEFDPSYPVIKAFHFLGMIRIKK